MHRKHNNNSISDDQRNETEKHTQVQSESNYSIDVLSGGESECESLKRRNNTFDRSNKILNGNVNPGVVQHTNGIKSERNDAISDIAYFITKELLMTERTYKKDLEVMTRWLRKMLPIDLEIEECGKELWTPFNSMTIYQTKLLQALEVCLGTRAIDNNNIEANINYNTQKANLYCFGSIMLAFLQEAIDCYKVWVAEHKDSLQKLENGCNNSISLERICREVEQNQNACYLPLSAFALKPLYRLMYYQKIIKDSQKLHMDNDSEVENLQACLELLDSTCDQISTILPDSLNYSYLCQLQRDIDGFDRLVLTNRQFIKQGCLFKHTSRGPQQRIFFLFSDILLYGSKSTNSQYQFRIHGVMVINTMKLEQGEYSNSFVLYGGNRAITLSANSEEEKNDWMDELQHLIDNNGNNVEDGAVSCRSLSTSVSAEELPDHSDVDGVRHQRSNTLTHVCWHRNISLSWEHLQFVMENHLSGYLLRKFKNSHGWQKLWAVFTSFCLYFYKTCHDDFPLASLPLLGYVVTTPSEKDDINKDFVFKLLFRNHVYFFRAESEYTFRRWMEVISSATGQSIK